MMSKVSVIAKVLRILTVPPFMALLLVAVLSGKREDILTNSAEVIALLLLLSVIPALAYPWQKWTARDGKADREKQRNMAFVFTAIGYTAAFFWAIITHRNRYLVMICMTYFLAVVMLTVSNKCLHIRASGHACGVTAPLIFLAGLAGWKMVPLCLLLAGAAVWSSLHLKRHTIRELAAGCAVCITALAFSAGMIVCLGAYVE